MSVIAGGTGLDSKALMARISAIPGAPEQQDYDVRLRSGADRSVLRAGAALAAPLDQKYDIGCMQDFLAGAVVFALGAEGRLDPYAPISAHFPELGEVADDIRPVDLLAHASGFAMPSAMPDSWETLAGYLIKTNKIFPAGKVVNYGTIDYLVLLEFIERSTGEGLYPHLDRLIFSPAGIGLELGEDDRSILSRRSILARLDQFEALLDQIFAADGPWAGVFLHAIERDQVRCLHGGHMAINPLPVAFSWGVGLFANRLLGLNGNTAEGALGMRFDPFENLSIVGHFRAGQVWRGQVFEQLAEALGHPPPRTRPKALGGVRGLDISGLAGGYRASPDARCKVHVSGRNLSCLVFRDERLIANIRAFVEDDGLITGASRMAYGRLDFFPHPVTGEPAMTVGLNAYAAENG